MSKKFTRRYGLVLGASAALLLGAPSAGAEDHEAESEASAPKVEPSVPNVESSQTPKAQKRAERRKADLEKLDTDGDGEVSPAERKAAKKGQRSRRAERIEKYDENGDG